MSTRAPRRLPAILSTLLLALALSSCGTRALPHRTETGPASFDVLMINGGGSRAQNYQSHLLHVQQLYALLLRIGVPRERIAIFSGDGPDPATDLAVREQREPEKDFWLLRGTHLEQPLGPPITYANSTVDGAVLAPATKLAIKAWFEAFPAPSW